MYLGLGGVSTRRASRAGRVPVVTVAALFAFVLCFGLVLILLGLLRPPEGGPGPADRAPARGDGSAADAVSKVTAVTAPEDGREAPTAAREGSATDVGSAAAAPADLQGGTVSGKVRIVGTDDPAPGVIVVLRPEGLGGEVALAARLEVLRVRDGDRKATSDEKGVFQVGGVPPGDHRLFVLSGESDFVAIPPASGMKVGMTADLAPRTVDIEVQVGGTFQGRVIDGEGAGIQGATVTAGPADFIASMLDPDGGSLGLHETTSRDDGVYRLGGLPLDKRYILIGAATGKAKTISEELDLPRDERVQELDIQLLAGSTLAGRVVSGDGAPVEGSQVRLMRREAESLLLLDTQEATTDSSGAFRIETVPAGKFDLSAQSPTGAASVSLEVESDGESTREDILLTLAESAAKRSAIEGKVVDEAGTPVEGAALELAGVVPESGTHTTTATSAADGTFRFEAVPDGIFNLRASKPGHTAHLQVGVGPGSPPLEVLLRRVGSVGGVVISRATKVPVEGAVVRAQAVGEGTADMALLMTGQLSAGTTAARTARDGTFVLEGVDAGTLRLRAEASDFGPGFSAELTLAPGQEVRGIEVFLSEGGVIRGVVLAPDGSPAADAAVRATEISSNRWENDMKKMLPTLAQGAQGLSVRTDADGRFELAHLAPASFSLAASHPSFAASPEADVQLGPDEKRDGLVLRLRKPSAIRVSAREGDKPLPGLMVQVMGEGPMKMATTDAQGKATIEGVSPGDFLVQLLNVVGMMSGKGLTGLKQRAVSVGEGQVVEVEFIYGVGARIRGKVEGEVPGPMKMVVLMRADAPKSEEQPMGSFADSIKSANNNVGFAFIGPDGTYTVADVPDGEFTIEIPRIPGDLSQMSKLTPEQQKPLYRATVKVDGGKDVEHDIRIGSAVK